MNTRMPGRLGVGLARRRGGVVGGLVALTLRVAPGGEAQTPRPAWVVPDCEGQEPRFPPGSLFWMTDGIREAPVLYRTVVDLERDIEVAVVRAMLRRWMPAFLFAIRARAPIHLGEFGGFEQTPNDPFANPSTLPLLMDCFQLFDRFGWHFHYYSDRGVVRVRRDGSLEESLVQAAYRRCFGRGTLNAVRGEGRAHGTGNDRP